MDDITTVVTVAGHQSEPLASVLVLAQLLLERLLGLLDGVVGLSLDALDVSTGCEKREVKKDRVN